MRYKRLAILLIAASVFSGANAFAHHSFAATYDESKTQKIEGKLVEFQLRNPHSFVFVEVKDAKGEAIVYSIEWGAAGQLNLTGGKDVLKFGDPVVVIGSPGRNPEAHRLRMVKITRTSDGWNWGGTFD